MESVVFDGKEYVKASVLAARFRYTADYLGQLCRGKKVDARLVGRAWYINLDSLNQHRSGRYKTATPKETVATVAATKPSSHYLSRIDVEPILKKKTVSLVKATRGSLEEFPVKYVADDYSLIPHVNRQAISFNIHVDPAEAERVKIQKEKSPVTAFRAEALPEVYLKGRITVAGLEEATESEPKEIEIIEPEIKPSRMPEPVQPKKVVIQNIRKPVAISKHPVPLATVVSQVKITEIVPKPVLSATPLKSVPLVRPRVLVKAPAPHAPVAPVAPTKAAPRSVSGDIVRVLAPKQPSFKPQAVAHGEAKKAERKESTTNWLFVFFVLIISIAMGVAILGTRMEIFGDKGTTVSHWKFDLSELKERL
jgi:hypothetical protein